MKREWFIQTVAKVTMGLVVILVALAIYYALKAPSMPTPLNFAVGSIAMALAGVGFAAGQSMLNDKTLKQIMTKLQEIEEKMETNRLYNNSEQDFVAISKALTGIVRLIEHFKKNKIKRTLTPG